MRESDGAKVVGTKKGRKAFLLVCFKRSRSIFLYFFSSSVDVQLVAFVVFIFIFLSRGCVV